MIGKNIGNKHIGNKHTGNNQAYKEKVGKWTCGPLLCIGSFALYYYLGTRNLGPLTMFTHKGEEQPNGKAL